MFSQLDFQGTQDPNSDYIPLVSQEFEDIMSSITSAFSTAAPITPVIPTMDLYGREHSSEFSPFMSSRELEQELEMKDPIQDTGHQVTGHQFYPGSALKKLIKRPATYRSMSILTLEIMKYNPFILYMRDQPLELIPKRTSFDPTAFVVEKISRQKRIGLKWRGETEEVKQGYKDRAAEMFKNQA